MGERAFIGIEIGGTKLQLIAGDAAAQITRRLRLDVNRNAGSKGICRQIESGLTELRSELDVNFAAIGVGFGGPVDFRRGIVCRSHQVEGWEDFPLRDWMAERANVPVTLENDANTAALGESLSGSGKGLDTVFYANFGSGVGGGLVSRGTIYHGVAPGEVEFGHLRLDRTGATVESRCSGWAVDRRIRGNPGDGKLAELIRLEPPGGEARRLGPALAAGDPGAATVLDEVANDIGFALSHVVHLMHPDVIVLGGGLALVGEPLRSAVQSALRQHVMAAFAPGPAVRLAALGEDAVPVGALHLAARSISKERES